MSRAKEKKTGAAVSAPYIEVLGWLKITSIVILGFEGGKNPTNEATVWFGS